MGWRRSLNIIAELFMAEVCSKAALVIYLRDIEDIIFSDRGFLNNLHNCADILIKTSKDYLKISSVGNEDTRDIMRYIRNYLETKQ